MYSSYSSACGSTCAPTRAVFKSKTQLCSPDWDVKLLAERRNSIIWLCTSQEDCHTRPRIECRRFMRKLELASGGDVSDVEYY